MALLHCDFFSNVLGVASTMDVILPQTTARQIGGRGVARRSAHPCLLLLHGLSDDHTIWQRRTSIERYVEPLGLAVVMPNVHRSFYTDMQRGPRYWTFISEELPALARSFFRLSDRREDNFVAGLAMGGYGACKLALRLPRRFAAAASLSGALDLAVRVREPGDGASRDFELIFGTEPDISGSDDDLLACAGRLAAATGPKPRLYQWCGTEDFLYADNRRFYDQAVRLGLKLTYEEGPGMHERGAWDRQIQRVLEWLPLKRR